MRMWKYGDVKVKRNGSVQMNNEIKGKNRYMKYHGQKTCSICGQGLPRPSMKICDSCAQFMRQKHIADL